MVHDENIKKNLEKRLIQPSSTSWNRLEKMLDSKEKVKPTKRYFKYTIATSVLVLLGSITFFMNSGSSINEIQHIVVETDNNILIEPSESIKNTPEENLRVLVGKSENTMSDIDKMDNKDTVKSVKNINSKHTRVASVFVTKSLSKKKEILSNSIENNVDNESLMVASLTNEDENNIDSEVDMLLVLATQEINKSTLKKSPNKTTITVDADALLADVEQELDLSFKANVFNKLKNGFQKTKTAVVKRNEN